MQAWRTREKLRDEIEGNDEEMFSKIPSLLDRMAAIDEETVTRVNMMDARFVRCFVAPGSTRYAFLHCRKLLALDGTFIKSRFRP